MNTIWHHRQRLKASIRKFFTDRGYVEIDTPILVQCPGAEVHLDYFETSWTSSNMSSTKLFLRSSPELHMKRVLKTAGNKIFQFAPSFRNMGEHSQWHHPEFTMLEWYEAGIEFKDFINETEELIQHCYKSFNADDSFLNKPIPKLSIYEAFKKYANLELIDLDSELASKGIQQNFISLNQSDDFETAFFKIMLDVIEPKIAQQQALILYDYPPSMAALAKVQEDRAKRFELYLNGQEICNAFLELVDPAENRTRLKHINKLRTNLQKQPVPLDEDFLADIGSELASCCGNALGFDRLLAMLLNEKSIEAVIPFRSDY